MKYFLFMGNILSLSSKIANVYGISIIILTLYSSYIISMKYSRYNNYGSMQGRMSQIMTYIYEFVYIYHIRISGHWYCIVLYIYPRDTRQEDHPQRRNQARKKIAVRSFAYRSPRDKGFWCMPPCVSTQLACAKFTCATKFHLQKSRQNPMIKVATIMKFTWNYTVPTWYLPASDIYSYNKAKIK